MTQETLCDAPQLVATADLKNPPPRPGMRSSIDVIAPEFHKKLKQYCNDIEGSEVELEDIKGMLLHAGSDAYQMAKYLDNECGWEIDGSLLTALADLDHIPALLIEKETEKWVEAFQIKLTIPIGEAVPVRFYTIDAKEGVVVSHYPAVAKYGISVEGQNPTSVFIVKRETLHEWIAS